MNYEEARKRLDDGKWAWTTDNGVADEVLGRAWRLCEAALPEGWEIDLTRTDRPGRGPAYAAGAWPFFGHGSERGDGPTPVAALDALRAELERR